MTICRYFQTGTCRYGNSCKYEHKLINSSNSGTSIMRQNKPSTSVDVPTLVKSVQNDMLNSEKGGQWLLSSYAPFKEKPTFPGFEDLLFEEVRLAYYEANATGNVEEYKRQLQESLQAAAQRVRLLQEPSEHVAQTLLQLYNATMDVGQPAAPPLQHGALPPAALPPAPGAAVAGAGGFAAPSPFAAGGAAPAPAFAPPPAVAQLASSGGNIFTSSAPASGGIFAQALQNYESKTAEVAVASPPPAQHIFAQAAQKFVAPPPAASSSAPPAVAATATAADASYTPLDDLPPDARDAFAADAFEFGRIPTRPPPANLCA